MNPSRSQFGHNAQRLLKYPKLAGPASALSYKFGTHLSLERIAFEGPAKGPGSVIPLTPKAGDAMSHLSVGRGAGPLEALAFEDTEPEFDLVEPRRMERAGRPGAHAQPARRSMR